MSLMRCWTVEGTITVLKTSVSPRSERKIKSRTGGNEASLLLFITLLGEITFFFFMLSYRIISSLSIHVPYTLFSYLASQRQINCIDRPSWWTICFTRMLVMNGEDNVQARSNVSKMQWRLQFDVVSIIVFQLKCWNHRRARWQLLSRMLKPQPASASGLMASNEYNFRHVPGSSSSRAR